MRKHCHRLPRRWTLAALLGTFLLGACESSPQLANASFDRLRHGAPGALQRDYHVYRPATLHTSPALVVYLHGCNQTAADAALGTRWNALADEMGFLVVYPEQRDPQDVEAPPATDALDGNSARCWNWFLPAHTQRDAGEPAVIAGITREVMAAHGVDPRRVYVIGASAGGVMAGTMGVSYPDLYAAVGMLAGCGYPACLDPTGYSAAQAMRPYAQRLPAIVFHGSADLVAPLALGVNAVRQWLGMHDWLDDGVPDGSVALTPAATEHVGLSAQAATGFGDLAAIGDLCLSNGGSPCIGGLLGLENSYPYSVQRYTDANGLPLLDFWIIHGLMHNYPGGDPRGSFVDPLGPDITRAAWDFFTKHLRTP